MKYRNLENRVLAWADKKGILKYGIPIAQANKTVEETAELVEAIEANNPFEIKDALGDILVTIIIQAKMQELDLLECLKTALEVIEKRNGKMINGEFVKE